MKVGWHWYNNTQKDWCHVIITWPLKWIDSWINGQNDQYRTSLPTTTDHKIWSPTIGKFWWFMRPMLTSGTIRSHFQSGHQIPIRRFSGSELWTRCSEECYFGDVISILRIEKMSRDGKAVTWLSLKSLKILKIHENDPKHSSTGCVTHFDCWIRL